MRVIDYICRIKLLKLIKLLFLLFASVFLYFIITQVFFKENNVKILIWWTPFMPNRDRVVECNPDGYKCLISNNRHYISDNKLGSILFYGSKIENFDFPLPRNLKIPWAIFHEESPKNYAPFLFKETQDLFNITSTISRFSDFPVTLQYLRNISYLRDKKYFVPIKRKNELLEQLSPVLYVQSDCDTPIGRDYFVNELSKHISIDSYGSCLKNKSFPEGLSEIYPLDIYNDNYMHFVSKYKFVISIENAICEDYVTEKFWRPLIAGSIPIYLGAPNIEDWLPNRNSAILIKKFLNVGDIADFIQKVNKDDVLYNSFLEHKLIGKIENKILINQAVTDHPIPEFECYICKKIHKNYESIKVKNDSIYNCPKPIERRNEKNSWGQHWDIGKCQSKALRILIEKNIPYTEDKFDKTWKELYIKKNVYNKIISQSSEFDILWP